MFCIIHAIDDHAGHDHGEDLDEEGALDLTASHISEGLNYYPRTRHISPKLMFHSHSHYSDDHAGHDHGEESSEFSSMANADESSRPWGQVILYTLIVNLATLSGVFIVFATAVHRKIIKLKGGDEPQVEAQAGHGRLFDIGIPSFAVGALLGTAVFLIMPEALHLIEGENLAVASCISIELV